MKNSDPLSFNVIRIKNCYELKIHRETFLKSSSKVKQSKSKTAQYLLSSKLAKNLNIFEMHIYFRNVDYSIKN